MATTISSSTINKVIAQGEDFPIFIKIYSSVSSQRFDEVWGQTDEGYTTDSIQTPPFGATCQLVYPSATTTKFTPGKHHVRIWGRLEDSQYVLIELVIMVNPKFPYTAETENADYEYESPTSNSAYVTGDGSIVSVSAYTGRLSNIAQWSSYAYSVADKDSLPDTAEIGDIAYVEGTYPVSHWICVKAHPAEWVELAVTSEGFINVTDKVYLKCEPFEIGD